VPLEHKDAVIAGQLIDVLAGAPASGPIWAAVFGEDERGHWAHVPVNPELAEYWLGVVSGTWHLRAWVDPESGYVAIPTDTVVTAPSGPPTPLDFPVLPIESSISGHVFQPDGTAPVPGAFVFAEGESPVIGYFETSAESDEFGFYELWVPEGGYVVGAALPGDELEMLGWLNPQPVDVPWVSPVSPTIDLDLQFRKWDGWINGTVGFAPGINYTPTHPAYVWGWADSGDWAETEAMLISGTNVFSYVMPVISGTVWHVGAVYDDWSNGLFYESPEEIVDLTGTSMANQDLKLGGPWPMPQPLIISFDGSQMQTIILPDGLELSIPGGSLVTSGTVTLFVFPTMELRPEKGRELIGAGYEIWAVNQNGREITQFNQNVKLTMPYPDDATLMAHGIDENLLIPVYYSTLVGHWILADSYIVNTVNNEITLQISHFTKFGTVSTEPAQFIVYLPVALQFGQ
jgi:hypothetical protein